MNPFDIESNNVNKSALIRNQILRMKILESERAIMHGMDIKSYRSTLRQAASSMGMKFLTRKNNEDVIWIKRIK